MMPRLNSNHRRRSEKKGRNAEAFAALYLRAKLYTILAKRFKSPGGEIDLIAKKGDTIIFVEVKMRSSRAAEFDALSSVNQGRIIKAAQFFLVKNPQMAQKNLRFDVIFIAPFAWPHHLRGAFETN